MALPANIAALSQNPALNGPDGATDPPAIMDDGLRLAYSFTAQLRDGVGFSAGAIPAALGYTPVRQFLTGTIYVGWDTLTSKLGLQVDGTYYSSTWPINITGAAATAAAATTAATANNSNLLGGFGAGDFVRRVTLDAFTIAWDSGGGFYYVNVNGASSFAYTHWNVVQGRPTQLSQFTNNLGTINSASIAGSTIQGVLSATGQTVNWTGFLVSDAGVKKNVQATAEDSLDKIDRLDFKQFDFDLDKVPHQTAEHQRLGIIAQQANAIDPAWAGPVEGSDYLHLRDQPLLMAALHAIKQLHAEVQELRGRVIELEAR